MNTITIEDRVNAENKTFKVDPHKGKLLSDVSSQWHSRPDDQRFLSLVDLQHKVETRSLDSTQDIVDAKHITIRAQQDDPDTLKINFLSRQDEVDIAPTHWSFGQLSTLAGAPAGYMRKLPAVLAGVNLQYGLQNLRQENVKLYFSPTLGELFAATGTEYGRVYDSELVSAVRNIAGNGTGDTIWKVPGAIDWSTYTYNPYVTISKETTTLYASDRDVFMFLVDDTRPIEIGKLSNGEPDIVFRGFYAWNSEVGSKTLGIATFLFRAVCQNRNIWGTQDYSEVTIRHSKNAPTRFAAEVGPALLEYSKASDQGIILGIQNAKSNVVAKTDDERFEWLNKRGFSSKQAASIINVGIAEEGHPPESIWDFVQGITATARNIGHTDERIALEKMAGSLLKRAS